MANEHSAGSTPQDELARKAAEFRILQRVSARINTSLDLHGIYRIALDTMGELFGFHHAVILLADETEEELTVVASKGYEGQAIGGKVRTGVGVLGMVAKKRRHMAVNNLSQQRAYVSAQRRRMVEAGREEEIGETIPVPGLPNAESQIAVPLLVDDSLIGVFSVESSIQRSFDAHERDLVMIVANQTASAIQSARMYLELQKVNQDLEQRVAERTEALEHRLKVAETLLKNAEDRVDGPLIGDSDAVEGLRASIQDFANADRTLLISGHAGVGKEATARAIHAQSARRLGPFIHITCSRMHSIHTGGSGADSPILANFDLAAGGTLFLEGVNDLSRERQAELVEAISRLNAARANDHTPDPDTRVIVSSTRDLFHEVQTSNFNRELYAQLKGGSLIVPPLVDRLHDIPALVEHFIDKHSRKLGKTVTHLNLESLGRLETYSWPGNIRELENVLERAIFLGRGTVLNVDGEMLGGVSVGSYRLVEQLGSGGMGEVWLGKHQLLARPAAVKLIRSDGFTQDQAPHLTDRFEREAQVTANLKSPHTVQLYDFGVSDTGTFYYVMELLRGLDANQIVRRFGPLAPERVVTLLRQACCSLSEAHDHGLVHRDIKPANLFITNLGPDHDFVKVLDFGMVKAELGDGDVQLTAEGATAGTPAFIAPELVLGGHTIDGRTDVYSLGCVAYWLLTGQFVFPADNATRMILHHCQTPPQPCSEVTELDIPESMDRVVLACLAKNPADRPQSAWELWEALGEVTCAREWTRHDARKWWQDHAPEALG